MKKFTFVITLIFLFGINYGQQWQWARILNHQGNLGPVGSTTPGGEMTTDVNGNFYLKTSIDTAESFEGFPVSKGTFIAKFNTSGVIQWAKSFPNAGKIKFNKQNNLCVTGYFTGTLSFGALSVVSKGNSDIYIAQMNANGVVVALKSFGGPGNDKGIGIDVGRDDRIFITGSFQDSLNFDTYKLNNPNNFRGFFVVCVDSSLNAIWAAADTLTSATGYDIASDGNNNCYTWSTYTDTMCYMYCRYQCFSKFSNSGTKIISKPSNSYNSGYDIQTMNSSVFMYGIDCHHQNCGTSAFKYDDQLNMKWYKNWTSYYHIGLTKGILLQSKESIVAGSYGSWAIKDSIKFDSVWVKLKGKNSDVMVTKLDSTGNHIWFKTAGGPGEERIEAITADQSGNYFVFGWLMNYSTGADTLVLDKDTLISNGSSYSYFIAKLSTGVASSVPVMANVFSDVMIYPNPSKGKVHFSNLQNASLRVFNYLGQDILYSRHEQDIEIDQPSGVYFVEVTSSNNRTIKKLIIE